MMEEKLITCENCKQKVDAKSKFCPLCGAKISSRTPAVKVSAISEPAEPWEFNSESSRSNNEYSSPATVSPEQPAEKTPDTQDYASKSVPSPTPDRPNSAAVDYTANRAAFATPKKKKISKLWLLLLIPIAAVVIVIILLSHFFTAIRDNADILDSAVQDFSEDEIFSELEDDFSEFNIYDFDIKGTLENQVIYDENNIKITVTGTDMDALVYGYEIKLLIENNSDASILVSQDNMTVNGYSVYSSLYSEVAPGNKADDSIYISSSDMWNAGITDISEVGLYLYFMSPDTYEIIEELDPIILHTSIYGSYTQEYDTSGQPLYDDKNVKILFRSVADDDYGCKTILFYIENNSDETLTISSDDMSINGFMVDSYLYSTLYPKTKSICLAYVYDDELEAANTDEIEDVSMSFDIYVSDTFDQIATSDRVNFSCN